LEQGHTQNEGDSMHSTIDRICHYYLEQGHTQNEGDSMHSTIDRICHYYLEQGHTQNEGDSMHSTTEVAAKNVNVLSPMQCHTVAGTAKETCE